MSRRIAIPVMLLAALWLVFPAPQAVSAQDQNYTQNQNYSYARIVRLSYVDGEVQVQRPEETCWEDALINLPIRQGYQISTRQGRAEIEFESGAVARLAEDSQLEFVELALADGNRMTQLSLLRGTATFYANLSSDDRFAVATPLFTVTVPRNARFRVDVDDAGGTVSVLKGDVSVDALGASYRVTKNRAFLFHAGDEQVTLARAPEMDAWDRWVEDRENVLSASRQAASLRYTSAPFTYGMYDLDYYGGWYNLPGYGYGWQPRGIGFGWSPYCSGAWRMMGGSLTWISYEPWGWTPYHYGSWIFARNGWYWIPGGFHHWRPSIVYWVNLGGNRWGWGPRGPHDRPGQPPANLPHGTVVTGGSPGGFVGGQTRRFDNARPAELTRASVSLETPAEVEKDARFRGRAGVQREFGSRPTAPGATPTTGAAASGYSGTATPAQPRETTPVERPDVRTRERTNDGAPASGIVYDPKERRYVNGAAIPGRKNENGRTESADAPAVPAAPAANGYSSTPTTPAQTNKQPTPEVRRTDSPNVRGQTDETRVPGRRDQQVDSTPRTPNWQSTSPTTQTPQRTPSVPAPQAQPRNEAPRYTPTPQPRNDTPRYSPPPRPAQQSTPTPRYEPSRPPSQPPQRVEPARPSTPPPAPAPAPRAPSSERQTTKPPHHN